ncbi:dihydrofolate reductase-like [Haliotis rufescens]|uniref:dihydrofolate reductase-like n=1 Tax=Haliotis rufescens TaxID=6454 RepID=UPI00201F4A84|nr:dihydrofolate reductase-like [Haliotis rufescens]
MAEFRLKLVVAACKNGGIGKDGQLPWKLKKDMAFFKSITSSSTQNKTNVVIMGRKTWDSIPAKFRPLKNRINIVLSRTMDTSPEGVVLSRSLEEALEYTERQGKDKIDSVFVIGGSSVYKEAIEGPWSTRVYLTRVMAEFECDTFMPSLDELHFKKTECVEDVPTGVHSDNGTEFVFEVYDKIV